MTSINQPDTFGKLENEYAKMKRDLYQNSSLEPILPSKSFNSFYLGSAYYAFQKYTWKREYAKENIITLFFLFRYTIALWRNYLGNKSNFDSSFDAFYISYCIAQLEGIIMSRVPRLYYRIIFIVIATVLRALFIPMNNKGLAVI